MQLCGLIVRHNTLHSLIECKIYALLFLVSTSMRFYFGLFCMRNTRIERLWMYWFYMHFEMQTVASE